MARPAARRAGRPGFLRRGAACTSSRRARCCGERSSARLGGSAVPIAWHERLSQAAGRARRSSSPTSSSTRCRCASSSATERGWCERLVGLGPDGGLAFGLAPRAGARAHRCRPLRRRPASGRKRRLRLARRDRRIGADRRRRGARHRLRLRGSGLRRHAAGGAAARLRRPARRAGRGRPHRPCRFRELAAAAQAAGAAVHGPVTQGAFLRALGIADPRRGAQAPGDAGAGRGHRRARSRA